MDLEIAIVAAKDGDAAGLVDVMNNGGGRDALLSVPGCLSAKILPGIEEPGNVLFLVEWESVDAHNLGRTHEGFEAFKRIAGPFFGQGGSMQHFRAG